MREECDAPGKPVAFLQLSIGSDCQSTIRHGGPHTRPTPNFVQQILGLLLDRSSLSLIYESWSRASSTILCSSYWALAVSNALVGLPFTWRWGDWGKRYTDSATPCQHGCSRLRWKWTQAIPGLHFSLWVDSPRQAQWSTFSQEASVEVSIKCRPPRPKCYPWILRNPIGQIKPVLYCFAYHYLLRCCRTCVDCFWKDEEPLLACQ